MRVHLKPFLQDVARIVQLFLFFQRYVIFLRVKRVTVGVVNPGQLTPAFVYFF